MSLHRYLDQLGRKSMTTRPVLLRRRTRHEQKVLDHAPNAKTQMKRRDYVHCFQIILQHYSCSRVIQHFNKLRLGAIVLPLLIHCSSSPPATHSLLSVTVTLAPTPVGNVDMYSKMLSHMWGPYTWWQQRSPSSQSC